MDPAMAHRFFVPARLLSLAGLVLLGCAEGPGRSSVIDELASHLRSEYAFEEMGARLATTLQDNEAAGAYAEATSAEALGLALTRDLQAVSQDRHLRVVPLQPPAGEQAGPPNGAIEGVSVLDGNIGYLRMLAVPALEQARGAVAAAFAALQQTDALILDCRDNGGGDPRTVAWYVSHLLQGPAIVINRFHIRGGGVQEFATTDLGALSYGALKPVFVLISPRTFSGGEELAYDLQAMARAVLVGEVTGGGANPVRGVPIGQNLEQPLLAFIPFAYPENPFTHANWEGRGVQPDLEVPEQRALEVALEEARKLLAQGRE
jgi:hypothetical protein